MPSKIAGAALLLAISLGLPATAQQQTGDLASYVDPFIGTAPAPGARVLHIVGDGAADTSPYVQSLTLDGVPYASAWIDWSRLSDGATLEFHLGPAPSDWGH